MHVYMKPNHQAEQPTIIIQGSATVQDHPNIENRKIAHDMHHKMFLSYGLHFCHLSSR